MAEKREVIVGSIMGSPSVLVSAEGAAIEVVETKLTGKLREGLTAGERGLGQSSSGTRARSRFWSWFGG